MTTWEYCELTANTSLFRCDRRFWTKRMDAFRELGTEGWELIACEKGAYIFKRATKTEPTIVNHYNYSPSYAPKPDSDDFSKMRVIC